MSFEFDYELAFNLDDCLKELGLNEKGRVQQVVDNEVLRVCSPYVPFDTGSLSDSAEKLTVIGSGEILYACDNKARRLYYGEEDWNWGEGIQEGGLRGPYWVDRAMNAGGAEMLENAARKEVKK